MPMLLLLFLAAFAGQATAQVVPVPTPNAVTCPKEVVPQCPGTQVNSPMPTAPQASAAPLPPLDAALESAERVLKVIAYMVGGIWVYYNYFRGRTHRARLEVKIGGMRLEPVISNLAKISTQVKNAGLSKVELLDSGSAIRVYGYDATKTVDHWILIETYDSLAKNNHWIEPGVSVEEQILLPIEPGKYAAFRADLILNSEKVRWKTAAIF